jgi:hypothetical protein
MKRALIALAFLSAAFAAPASADCYTVLQGKLIVYRSEIAPIDLSGPIHVALQRRFPGGQLIISDNVKTCTFIDPSSPVDPLTGAAAEAGGGTVSAVSAQRTTMAASTGTASPNAAVEVDEGCRRGGTVTRRGEPCPDTAGVGQRVIGAGAAPAAPAAVERPVEREAVRRAR